MYDLLKEGNLIFVVQDYKHELKRELSNINAKLAGLNALVDKMKEVYAGHGMLEKIIELVDTANETKKLMERLKNLNNKLKKMDESLNRLYTE